LGFTPAVTESHGGFVGRHTPIRWHGCAPCDSGTYFHRAAGHDLVHVFTVPPFICAGFAHISTGGPLICGGGCSIRNFRVTFGNGSTPAAPVAVVTCVCLPQSPYRGCTVDCRRSVPAYSAMVIPGTAGDRGGTQSPFCSVPGDISGDFGPGDFGTVRNAGCTSGTPAASTTLPAPFPSARDGFDSGGDIYDWKPSGSIQFPTS